MLSAATWQTGSWTCAIRHLRSKLIRVPSGCILLHALVLHPCSNCHERRSNVFRSWAGCTERVQKALWKWLRRKMKHAMDDHIGGQIDRIMSLTLFIQREWSMLPPFPHRLSAAQKLTEEKFLAQSAEELVALICAYLFCTSLCLTPPQNDAPHPSQNPSFPSYNSQSIHQQHKTISRINRKHGHQDVSKLH